MTEMWLLVIVPALAWFMARIRSRRLLAQARDQVTRSDHVTTEEMSLMIRELSPGLRPSARVTSPSLSPESNHIWDSPSGKRVYMN